MPEDRPGGISRFGISFGGGAPSGEGDTPREQDEVSSFRIVVVAELVAGPDWSTGRVPSLDPIPIDAESFDRVMGQLGLSLAIDVVDPFGANEPPLRVDLLWRERKAMRPSEIVDQLPALRSLVDARRVVQDVATRKISAEQARTQLSRILPRRSWADALVGEVRAAPPPAQRRTAPAEAAATATPVAATGKTGGLDALLDMVDVGATEPSPASAGPASSPSDAARMVAAVARSARGQAPRAVVGSAPERLERAFQNLLDSILHHPEVRRLEATWRGLRLLVESCARGSGVEVDVISASREGVLAALGRLFQPDESRPPVDLILVDQRIEPVAVDLAMLNKWAGLAEALLAPIVVAGHPTMLGVDSLDQVARSRSALAASDDGRAVALRAVAAHESSRWLSIVLNDPLVRAPYTASTARQQEPPYAEDESDADAYVFASAIYVVAALCARSHGRRRWPTEITGARDGALGNLPVRTIAEHGQQAAIPLEVLPSEDAVKEVAKAGLTMLACGANTDAAILARAPVLHRGSGGHGATSSTLGDQIFVGRFARAVEQIANAIPAGTEPRAVEEVARIALAALFEGAAPPGPEIIAKVDAAREALTVTVRPRRFAGITMEELTLGAAIG